MLTPDEIRESFLSLLENEYGEKQIADPMKEYSDKIKQMPFDLLALKYLKEAHIPNEYCVYSKEDTEGTYHGRRLFDLNAVMVASKKDRTFATDAISITVSNELWIMENSDLAFVECTKMEILGRRNSQVVEQRLFQFFPFEKDHFAWPLGIWDVICALENTHMQMEEQMKHPQKGYHSHETTE